MRSTSLMEGQKVYIEQKKSTSPKNWTTRKTDVVE